MKEKNDTHCFCNSSLRFQPQQLFLYCLSFLDLFSSSNKFSFRSCNYLIRIITWEKKKKDIPREKQCFKLCDKCVMHIVHWIVTLALKIELFGRGECR